MLTLEKDVERALVRLVRQHGGLCLKWICPGRGGVPDRILLLPGGRALFVELKRPQGGRVSGLQKKWQEWLRDLGFSCVIVRGKADLEQLRLLLDEEVTP